MEQNVKTLAELKGEKVRIRNKIEGKGFSGPRDIADYRKVRRKIEDLESWLLWTIVSLILFIGGCGKMLEGTGRIMEGVGDGIVYAGEHIQESTSTKD